jgi:hypothetical protein
MTAEQLFQIIGEFFVENRMLRQEIVKLQKEITELKPKEVKKDGRSKDN